MFASSAFVSSSAFAETTLLAEWLVGGVPVQRNRLVETEGELLLEDMKLYRPAEMSCSGFDGHGRRVIAAIRNTREHNSLARRRIDHPTSGPQPRLESLIRAPACQEAGHMRSRAGKGAGGAFAVFKQCPRFTKGVDLCLYSQRRRRSDAQQTDGAYQRRQRTPQPSSRAAMNANEFVEPLTEKILRRCSTANLVEIRPPKALGVH